MRKALSAMAVWALALLLVLVLPTAACAETYGVCGDNLMWTLDDEGTLIISGMGEMYNYELEDDESALAAPWGTGVKTLIIEEGVTGIGAYAFAGCTSLVSVTLPGSLTSIDEYSFMSCYNIDEIHIDSIEDWLEIAIDIMSNPLGISSACLFVNGKAMTEIVIPEGVTHIKDWVFQGYEQMTRVAFPDSLVSIGEYAFAHCSGLTEINLPKNLTQIGYSAFMYLWQLKSVSIPEGVTRIEDMVFYHCSGLDSVTIPEGVTSIGWSAFCGCKELDSITIPASVTKIGGSAFAECGEMTLTFPGMTMPEMGEDVFLDTTPTIRCYRASGFAVWAKAQGYAIEYLDAPMKTATLPADLVTIEANAFEGTAVQCYILPDGVTTIGARAFADCAELIRVEIPASVTSIAADAFAGCEELTIIAPEGSAAHYYALARGFMWEAP